MTPCGILPKQLKFELDEITAILSPHTKRAYLVGGCVRDLYLNNPIKDIDIEVYDISQEIFDALMQRIGALGVGKSFFVYKYKNLDIALPRIERKIAEGHSGFEVHVIQDEIEASKRRDFTMNALMQNIFDAQILDFWGGTHDIEKKCIKHIDDEAFQEDSLRVLRGVQFAARFDFSIDEQTLHVMKYIDISDLSKMRIFWELEKLFCAKFLHVGLKYFYKLGLFEKIFGLHVEKNQIHLIEKELLDANFEKQMQEYYFLYIVCGILGVSVKDILKKLEVPNRYYNTFKYQPYLQNPSKQELLKIAMNIPIKMWLGNYQVGIKEQSLELGIYEKIYTGGIDIQDVIKEGFEKEAIKKEYERRVLETIKKIK